jgi:hypothetical protein
MNNLVKKSMLVVAVAASLSSCAKYYHSYRNVEVNPAGPVNPKMQVDVTVSPDFSKRLRAQSTKNHWRNKEESMKEAYFNAIVENQIDVLIAPIYSVTERGGFFDATVHGYAGYYKTVDKSESVSDFDRTVEDLKKLSTNEVKIPSFSFSYCLAIYMILYKYHIKQKVRSLSSPNFTICFINFFVFFFLYLI